MKYLTPYDYHLIEESKTINIDGILKYMKYVLFALGIGHATGNYIHNIMDKQKLKTVLYIYNQINSTPTKFEISYKDQIEFIRQDVINKVDSSNLFDTKTKSIIIDSLHTIDIRFIDNISILSPENKAIACYINVNHIKKSYDKNLIKDNFIFIDKDHMHDNNLSDIIVHELYHYVDKLGGINGEQYSKISNIDKFLDKSEDKKHYFNKIFYVLYASRMDRKLNSKMDSLGDIYGQIIEKSKSSNPKIKKEALYVLNFINDAYNSIFPDAEYFRSPEEMFVRYQGFKRYMVSKGYIKNIYDVITYDNFLNFLKSDDSYKVFNDENIFPYLLFVDWKKIPQMDRQLQNK